MFVSQQVVAQQPVTVVTQTPENTKDEFSPSALSQMKVLSILQIIVGVLCVIFGIALAALTGESYLYGSSGMGVIGYGIWIGLYFILVGAIGLGATSSNSTCMITAAMVLNIICSCSFWFILFVLSSIALANTEDNRCTTVYFFFTTCHDNPVSSAFLALDSLLLVMSFVELIITIWSAALCCGAVCRCCKHQRVGHVIHYNNSPAAVVTQNTMSTYPSVPATTSFGVYTSTPQPSGYAAAVHQQPAGYTTAPQGPPSYYQSGQSAPAPQNSGYEQPPPTAYPSEAPYQPKY